MKQKVLVVDDEKRNQRIISEILDDLVEMQFADSGEQALALVESFHPDLVLLDIMMPGLNGYEVCKKIKANPKFHLVKIILVSGKAMIDEKLQGYDAGADDYLTKPFVHEELLAKSKVFLRMAAAEIELEALNADLEQKVKDRTVQLMQTEAKLVNASRLSALGEMAGGIAHEVNTPLATISLLSSRIEDLLDDPELDLESLKKQCEIIRETVGRIGKIIQGLKTFSRDGALDSSALVLAAKLIDDTIVLCGERFRRSDVKLSVEISDLSLLIDCQAVQLSQVLLNLLNNAFDAIQSLPIKWVKIQVSASAEATEIRVTDSGSGIPEASRAKIFDPFFTTKEVGKGTGIGLSISNSIVLAHGGKLSLDTESPNTCFVIKLPPSGHGRKQSQVA